MKNKFLLIFCSAALLTVMNTSYASSLPASRGRSQMGGKVAGGKLCSGKLPGTYANYTARYAIGYSRDGLPILNIYFSDIVKEISDGDRGSVKAVFINGRSINFDDGLPRRTGTFVIQKYQFRGSDREYRIKSGDRVKVVFSHVDDLKDTIECTIPIKAGD
jgi:hypothetical protein